MKKQIATLLTILLFASISIAATNDLGASNFASWIKTIGSILCPAGLAISGIMIVKNKREGADHLSGALMGVFVFCASGSIFALISSWTK